MADLVRFVEPLQDGWPELTSMASLSLRTGETQTCCLLSDGAQESFFGCTIVARAVSVAVEPGLSSSSPAVLLHQFLFRYTAPDGDVIVAPWNKPVELASSETAEEYCYEIEAIDVVTGETHAYEELEGRCAAHGDLEPLGHQRFSIPDSALESGVCPLPPPGFGPRWCDVNNRRCDFDGAPPDCHFYDYTCSDGDHPGGGWEPAAVSEESDAGSDEDNDAADDEGASARADSSGCAVRISDGEPSQLRVAAWLLVLLLWLRVRTAGDHRPRRSSTKAERSRGAV